METSGYKRLQVTLFLPPSVGPRIDEVRSRWDPVMAARIASHVTVLRRVPDPDVVIELLQREPKLRTCRLGLAGVERAPASDGGGVYLQVDDPFSDLLELREALRPACGLDADAVQEFAHVTLVHPPTTTPVQRDRAWLALSGLALSAEGVAIPAVSLIGETDMGWAQIASFDLTPT